MEDIIFRITPQVEKLSGICEDKRWQKNSE